MGERRWPTVLIIVILIGLIYNFLNTIFRSDVKRYSQDRIYVDYSTYTKKEAGVEHVEAERPRGFGRKIDQAVQNVFEGRMEASAHAFDSHMATVLEDYKMPGQQGKMEPPPPVSDPELLEIQRLGSVHHQGLTEGQGLFQAGKFQDAVVKLNDVLEALPANDFYNRTKVFEQIAECYFQLRNQEGYVQYKVKFLEVRRQLGEVLKRTYREINLAEYGQWISSEDATQHLLRIKTFALQNLRGEHRDTMIRRAQYDLEVSRRVN